MGGIFAVSKAFDESNIIKGLVLLATSAGIDFIPFNVQDWRAEYPEDYLRYPEWFMAEDVNYDAYLERIDMPILLI